MNGRPDFRRNQATVSEIAGHLRVCDQGFVPPLGERVRIEDYARKIADRSERFEAWADGELVGLVAAYCTDPKQHVAFITSVSVVPAWQGRGIASQLVGRCLEHVRQVGFRRTELHVNSRNPVALALYARHGFVTDSTDGHSITMSLVMG
jgi:ribosomal protein S18 acetylase RimI-like enzyme